MIQDHTQPTGRGRSASGPGAHRRPTDRAVASRSSASGRCSIEYAFRTKVSSCSCSSPTTRRSPTATAPKRFPPTSRSWSRLSCGRDRSGARDDLRAFPGSRAQSADAAVPQPCDPPGAAAQPDGQGGGRSLRDGRAQRADAHLPGAPGRRHSVLPREPGPCRLRPAPAHRAGPHDRPTVQPPLRPRSPRVHRARGDPQPGAGAARHRRRKTSKSRANAIAIGTTAEQTQRLIRAAKTDSDPHITYEPDRRPEISTSYSSPRSAKTPTPSGSPRRSAPLAPARSSAEPPRRSTSDCDPSAPPRAALLDDRTYLRQVLRLGSDAASAIADETLMMVRNAMHTSY